MLLKNLLNCKTWQGNLNESVFWNLQETIK